jgi:4-hydroxybenzoate polyprenyltransferase
VAASDGDAEVIRQGMLLVRMMRLKVLVTLWTFLLIGLARHAGPIPYAGLALAGLALAAGYAVATTANDISDIEIDRVNRPRDPGRPLVTGDASVPDLWRTNALAGGIAFAATVPLGAQGLVIVGTSLAVSYAYSVGPIRLSHRWTHIAGRGWDRRDVPLVAGLFVLFVARIVLKDLRDRLGDAAFGKPTMLLRLGKRATCIVSVGGAALGTAILIGGLHVPASVAAMLAIYGIGIAWMLIRLATVLDPRLEQVAIGVAARAGNGLLISILALLFLRSGGAHERTTEVFIASLLGVFAVSFLDAALHPERVRIGYKA